MRVLVACEFSGVVRRAFASRGHDAWSCDILPAADGSPNHLQCDVLTVLDRDWDLMIAHPPCTHLAVSGARWMKAKREHYDPGALFPRDLVSEAMVFFMKLALTQIPRVCVENPVCIMSSKWRKPDQVIQPWQFGHGETKATCLWLRNLPLLVPTDIVAGREAKVHRMPPSPDRWAKRSVTFQGIANAMASQWSDLPVL